MWTRPNHTDCWQPSGTGTGPLLLHTNRCYLDDVTGEVSSFATIQHMASSGGHPSNVSIYNSLFSMTPSGSYVATATHMSQSFTVDTDTQDVCPTAINIYNNVFSNGASGYWSVNKQGSNTDCDMCSWSATDVHDNANVSTAAPVTGPAPGGDCP